MRIKLSNFMNSFHDKFDTSENSKLAKNLWLEIYVEKAISLSILDGFQQMRTQNLS